MAVGASPVMLEARFIEAARELESDESGKAFERAVRVVIPVRTK